MIRIDLSQFREEVKKITEGIKEAVGEKELRGVGFEGARIFRDEAIQNAAKNRRTGVLMNNIIVKRLEEESSESKQAYLVTVRTGKFGTEGDAFYWRFVEYGHSYVRRAKNKKDTLKKRRAEALEFGTSSTPAYPFMRPAYESKKQEAADAMSAKLQATINEKLGRS